MSSKDKVCVAIACLCYLTACHGDKHEKPEQSEHDGVALLCGAQAAPSHDPELHNWLAQQVTNPGVRRFLDGLAEEPPWEIKKRIEKLGRDTGVAPCHPLEGLAGIRARNGIDVPLLADARGTIALEDGPTIAITPTRINIESVGSFDIAKLDELAAHTPPLDGPVVARVAVDRAVTFATLRAILTALAPKGLHHSSLVITAPDETRAVALAFPKAQTGAATSQTVAVINLGSSVRLNGEDVTLDELRRRITSWKPDQIFLTPEPDVSVQRLAEALAITGEHTYLGDALLPHVEPAPQQR
jgi:biopolymer transport protein ExbD